MREEKSRSKIGQKSAPLPQFLQFFSPSLSPPFQPPTRATTSFSTTSPTTGSYPNHKPATPCLKQPSLLPLSHFCRSLHLLPAEHSGHRSSQKHRQNHQLSLLITAETPTSSEPLLRQPPFFAAISVACRTWTTVHVLQIINIASGLGPARPKKLKKKIFWVDIGPTILGRCWPTYSGLSSAQSAGPAQPTCFNIYIYISLQKQKNKKKIQKNFKNHFKKIVIFSNIFLPILHNIGLYIYTVKYKSGIKIPGFLWNIF